MLRGTYYRNLGRTGDLTIPKRLRAGLAAPLVVWCHEHPPYFVSATDAHHLPHASLRPSTLSSSGPVHLLRIDSRGRILLPADLRSLAGLADGVPVVVVGVRHVIEIWSIGAWTAELQRLLLSGSRESQE